LTRSKNFARSTSTTIRRPCCTYSRAAFTAWCALRLGRKPLSDCQWNLGDSGFYGSVPDLAAADNGAVYLSYVAGNEVHLATLGGATEPVLDSTGPGTRFRKPRVAWGGGVVHLVWGSTAQDLELARLTPTGWEREHVATVDALFSVPQVAATPDGATHVIYQWCQTTDCPTSPTVYLRRAPVGTWSLPDLVSDDSREWRDDALAADGLGRVHALWKGAFQPGQYRQVGTAGQWLPLEEVGPYQAGATVSFGDVAIGPDHEPCHAWYEFGISAICYSERWPAGQWSQAELLSPPGLEESGDYDMRPGLAVSPQGVVVVVWAQYSGSEGGPGPIWACLGLQGQGTWDCGEVAADSGVTVGGKPAVAYAAGAFHIVWRHTDDALRHLTVTCPQF